MTETVVKPAAENPIVVMKRYEFKYILNAEQAAYFVSRLQGHMLPDQYGVTSIASLYYDTPDRRLINASLEKPLFKEKIRLRSYGLADRSSPVYLELKRKAFGVVYKRRVQTVIPQADAFFAGQGDMGGDSQIGREIQYFKTLYPGLAPAYLIIYDRQAYYEPGGDLRLTLDRQPRWRADHLDLTYSMAGKPLLPRESAILEVKVQEAMPLWLSAILNEGGICKGSFSKVGEAYRQDMAGQGRAQRQPAPAGAARPQPVFPAWGRAIPGTLSKRGVYHV